MRPEHPRTTYAHPHLDLRAALANAVRNASSFLDPNPYRYGDTAAYTDTINVPTVSITVTGWDVLPPDAGDVLRER
jgi:hypothetical protein